MIIEHEDGRWEIRPESTELARRIERQVIRTTLLGGVVVTAGLALTEPILGLIPPLLGAVLFLVGRNMKVTVWLELTDDALALRTSRITEQLATRGQGRVVVVPIRDGFGNSVDQWVWWSDSNELAVARIPVTGWDADDLRRACGALGIPITRDPETLTLAGLHARYPVSGGRPKPWKALRS